MHAFERLQSGICGALRSFMYMLMFARDNDTQFLIHFLECFFFTSPGYLCVNGKKSQYSGSHLIHLRYGDA